MARPKDIPPQVWERADILRDQLQHISDDTEYTARLIMALQPVASGMTAMQSNLLKFYREFQEKHGHTPSYAEVAKGLGIGRTRVFDVLHQLEGRGLVSLAPSRARSVTILAKAS